MLSNFFIALGVAFFGAGLVWVNVITTRIYRFAALRQVHIVRFEKVIAVVASTDYWQAVRDNIPFPRMISPVFIFSEDGKIRYGGKERNATGTLNDYVQLVRDCDKEESTPKAIFVPFVKAGLRSFEDQELLYDGPLPSFAEAYIYLYGHNRFERPTAFSKAREYLIRRVRANSAFMRLVSFVLFLLSILAVFVGIYGKM